MLQTVKYYYKSPFAASLDQKIHSFLSKVFLRVPGSQQSSRGREGHGRSSFVLRGHNVRGCPIPEILQSAPETLTSPSPPSFWGSQAAAG